MALLSTQPKSNTVEDVDAMAATMADGLKSEYVQLERGPFAARWDVCRLPSMVVQFGREQMAVARRMRTPEDRWAFLVPLAVPGSARWNGCVISGGEVVVCAPRSEGYAFDPGGMHFAVISVSPMTAAGLANASVSIAPPTDSCVLRPDPSDVSALQHELLGLEAAMTATGARDASSPSLRAHRLANRLLKCLGGRSSPSVPGARGRSRIVQRAEEFFRRHVGEPVSIAQLSAIAEVSERSLRNAFYRVYSTSPKRYLRLWQLHQVRRALRAADGPEATVTDVATFHGFYELGRFAGEYKALFGEAPSQTLQKTRIRNATRGAA
jgi:AraC family ethanolamine operon transcriptional activator